MCIALISTAHPLYSLILIDNRDEFLHRPTSNANWWAPPNSHVLGAQDLLREVQGTWLGMTRQGRIAVLTNYREEGQNAVVQGARSRGTMVNSFLTVPPDSDESTAAFVKRIVDCNGEKGVGGFSLVCGKVGEPLAVISNRTPRFGDVEWIATSRGETVGLSNAVFKDHTWPKVLDGERLMTESIQEHVDNNETEDELIDRLLSVLSRDTLPQRESGEAWESFIMQLKHSIFVPPIAGPGGDENGTETVKDQKACKDNSYALTGIYGTQKQTIVLVDHQGRARFFERTLFDTEAQPIKKGKGDRNFEFQIDGWKSLHNGIAN